MLYFAENEFCSVENVSFGFLITRQDEKGKKIQQPAFHFQSIFFLTFDTESQTPKLWASDKTNFAKIEQKLTIFSQS